MSNTTTRNFTINKLSVAQYKELKASGVAVETNNEAYTFKDIDEHLVEMKDISGKNLNSLTGKVILGYGNDCTNAPTDQNGFFLNLPHATAPTTYNRQYYQIRATHDLYTRAMENGVWGEYRKIAQSPCILTAYLASSYTISAANANAYKSLYLAQHCKLGAKLEMSSGGVKIGNHVSYVKVSGQIQLTPSGAAGIKHIRIYKNETVVGWASARFTTTAENMALIITPRLVPVVAGDVFTLRYYASASDQIVGTEQLPTMLTVEVVE